MAGGKRKQGSIFGTVISIYVLYMLLNGILRSNMSIRGGNIVIVIVIGVIVMVRILSMANKAAKTGKTDFTTERKNIKIPNKGKKEIDIIQIDESNHYEKQYRDLYESGILTKEELRERINKLNK